MSSEPEFKCVFCSETFAQKEDLQTHFRKHGDPSFNPKKDKRRFSDDNNGSSEKTKDHSEVVECDVCDEVFSSISKAITHKHKMHPDHDTKYFCPWCGKLFTMKHLYNKHINATHLEALPSEKKLFHCDSCEVDFFLPAAMLYHNKFYHRQDDLPNLGHSKKLKRILQEMVQIYYCPFCGEEHENKVNLHKHINEEHCGENRSPDDVFRCPLCDAIFFYLDAYELHLTYHSIEDVYTERNELMDEITDFSLETVQPIQEKVENADADNNDAQSTSMGIEELLEFSMNDPDNNRKSKKHKKHKKSKKEKAAITLDEFLSMNTDVFGEGIDFQGVEEVPTQVITKRLKAKKVVPTSTTSPALDKLKRQGIVIKKQSSKVGKSVKGPKSLITSAVNIQKPVTLASQTKPNALTSTDAVLSKLMNQGSQIKIVKKSNQEEPPQILHNDSKKDENMGLEGENETNVEEPPSEVDKTDATDMKPSKESTSIENPIINTANSKPTQESPSRDSPSLINNKELEASFQESCEENSNHSAKSNNDVTDDHLPEPPTKLTDNVIALQNNSNITMKIPKIITGAEDITHNEDNNFKLSKIEESINTQKSKENSSNTVKHALNPLERLSHLITVKPVNTNKAIPLPYEKLDKGSGNTEPTPASIDQPNNSSKSNLNPLSNLKKIDGITIKPSNKLNTQPTNNDESVKTEDNIENHVTDDEWHDDNAEDEEMDVEKLIPIGKSTQLHMEMNTPKPLPKPSLSINQNSQSSVDLLKHLKNVTAKPVNKNSQNNLTSGSLQNITVKNVPSKTSVQKEITEDGTEIFSIDDSDSDEGHCTKSIPTVRNEIKVETKKPIDALKNINKNITVKSTSQQREMNKPVESASIAKDDFDSDDEYLKQPSTTEKNSQSNISKPNQKNTAINNVLKNLSKSITVKSRNSSPSQSIRSQDSRDSHHDANDADSDSDTPLSRVKITEMDNMSDEDLSQHVDNCQPEPNVKVEHPDESHSDHDSESPDQDFDDMSDIEAQIAAAKVLKDNFKTTNKLKSQCTNMSQSLNKEEPIENEGESSPVDDIPAFAKNLGNQISIKQIKKPDGKNTNTKNQVPRKNQTMAASSNQVNTFNKEVKTVKTFQTQTQTQTVIQEITTTVTKTIKTVNQTTKQEVRNASQLNSSPMITQRVQSNINANLGQQNFQGVKVRQSFPNVRPKIRGQAPQNPRLAICPPPPAARPAVTAPVKTNQIVPARPPGMVRPTGPRPRMPNVVNVRPSTSGQQRPQMRPVKISPRAVITSAKNTAEAPGHFSCFKKPKESLIPEPDLSTFKCDADSSEQVSSTVQMSKSNFSSTSKVVRGNSVVTSSQTKSEMSASSQQLSKLRGVSGLVVKSSQSQAKQTTVEEKCEMSASKRNALDAIQKLQSQGLLVKKPRIDAPEDSDHSQHDSDDMMGNCSNEDEDM